MQVYGRTPYRLIELGEDWTTSHLESTFPERSPSPAGGAQWRSTFGRILRASPLADEDLSDVDSIDVEASRRVAPTLALSQTQISDQQRSSDVEMAPSSGSGGSMPALLAVSDSSEESDPGAPSLADRIESFADFRRRTRGADWDRSTSPYEYTSDGGRSC